LCTFVRNDLEYKWYCKWCL